VLVQSSLNQFLNEIGRYPLLTPEQELILYRQIDAMNQILKLPSPYSKEQCKIIKVGKRAKDKFVTSNLRMVVNVAKKYSRRTKHLELADLISEGITGLIRAVEKFDGQRGYKFSTYAYWWIRQSISRAIATLERGIRLPVNIEDDMAKLRKTVTNLSGELGRLPSQKEIAQSMECSTDFIDKLQSATLSITSLDAVISHSSDSSTPLVDLISDDSIYDQYEALDESLKVDKIKYAMSFLNHDEQFVMIHRYALNGAQKLSLLDIAKHLGVSKETVRRIYRTGQNKIKLYLNSSVNLVSTQFTYAA
jgi:RNA polymerase primary sigma factor